MTDTQIISSDETGNETTATLSDHLGKLHGWGSKHTWPDEHLARVHDGQHAAGKVDVYHAHPVDSSKPARKATGAQSNGFVKVPIAERIPLLSAWMVEHGDGFTVEQAAAASAPSAMSVNTAKDALKRAAAALAIDGYAVTQDDTGAWLVMKAS